MSQLLLNLDDTLLREAQEYAHRHGQQLETLVAELLRAAVRPVNAPIPLEPTRPLSPRVAELFGSLKVPADFDYKRELEEALAEKYRL